MMVIDVHAHYLSPQMAQPRYRDYFDLGRADGRRVVLRAGRPHNFLDEGLMELEVQLRDMDRAGIDLRCLCVPPYAFQYHTSLELDWVRETNDTAQADTAPYRDRFRLLANVPMGQADAAVRELERAMSHPAFLGAQIATNIAGTSLGDPALEPFWTRAEALGAFLLLHPFYQLEDPRLKYRYNANLIGNPLETTLAAFTLACEGVMERHPGLKICLCHGGGYAAFGMARMDHGYEVRPELRDVARPPSDSIRAMYLDTVVYRGELIDFLAGQFGADHILLGTDYPFDMGDPDPVSTVRAARLSPADRELVLHGNAERLLR